MTQIHRIEYIAGEEFWVPDAPSRAPTKIGLDDLDILEKRLNKLHNYYSDFGNERG